MPAMSDRFTPYAGALAAVAFLMALGGASAAETLQPKDQPPQLRNVPPAALYIHCATEGGDGPCALDPVMRRLNLDPLIDRRNHAPAPDPLDRPSVQPPR
jgi:hypothetical protein